MSNNQDDKQHGDHKGAVIYHRVLAHETFEEASAAIMRLLLDAQENAPNEPRYLCMDVDGHRNKAGGYDRDMAELQTEFMLSTVFQFVTEIHCPLLRVRNEHQDNNVPAEFFIASSAEEAAKRAMESETPVKLFLGDVIRKEINEG